MLAIGIMIFILGLTFRIILSLSYRYQQDTLTPRKMSERTHALNLLQEKRKALCIDANIMIAAGLIIYLFTGLFN
ncbi:MAG: hypothetical protein K2G90_01780 [Muribaculaceae bacterium]|nr:hypothetical protein [Muribaculaceae bacterium]MDE6007917.1 hypothetical protein [Muribaculaceae bacterium]